MIATNVAESEYIMKKSVKKIVNRLNQFIGHEIVRTKPTCTGDWSCTNEAPIILIGFTFDGCIIYKHTGWDARLLGTQNFYLPITFTDRNWITYAKALRPKSNPLNIWRGKKIRRIRPTEFGGTSFMNEAPILISATNKHILVRSDDGYEFFLDSRYAKKEDWELA